MKRGICIIFFILALSFGVERTNAQSPTDNPKLLDTFQATQENLCRQQTISENRAYSFRVLPRTNANNGAYGKKSWIKKMFPFLSTPLEKYGVDDIRTIKSEYARPVPLGESKRSKQIRLSAEEIPDLQQKVTLKRFDWRENGIDVGESISQNLGATKFCNTCWAFATVDAMQISRRIFALRNGKTLDETLRPSVRQLVSCMVKKEEEFCDFNWHGEAFSFMVDKGLPLGGTRKYIGDKSAHICDSETYVKALTWDFVSATPQKVAATDEIKRAIIVYGSVVSTISFDNCILLYGGGIFNEEQNKINGRLRKGSHLVLIIGWDDKKQAWLVKNSYGKDWGENGFGWMKYGSNNIGLMAAFVVADPKEEEKLADKIKQEKVN
jgi:Papain family cysteine protease